MDLFNVQLEADLSEFDSTVVDGGDLSQAAAAAMAGSAGGMQCVIDDTTAIYGQKNFASPASVLRFRFYLDPNGLTMAGGNIFSMCFVRTDTLLVAYVTFRYVAGTGYRVSAYAVDDAANNLETDVVTVSDDVHYIEVELNRASSAVAADGSIELYIDGSLVGSRSSVDNYDRFEGITNIRIGAVGGLDAGTSGTFYVDEIRGNDDGGTIGPRTAVPVFIRHYRNMRT